MSEIIFEGAEFDSIIAFENAFKTYCLQNAVNGIPLKFVIQKNVKLKPDTFKNETLDQATIDQFVYQKRAMVCVHRTKEVGNGNEINCGGRVTFRFDKEKKLILVSSFIGDHRNHPDQSIASFLARRNITPRERQLQSIIDKIKVLPDDTLNLIEETVEVILREWGKDNVGLNVAIEPIYNDENEPNQVEAEAQPFQTGKFTSIRK